MLKALGVAALLWAAWIGQSWAQPGHTADAVRIEDIKGCQVIEPEKSFGWSYSRMGLGERRALSGGNVVYETRFSRMDAEPESKLIFNGMDAATARTILSWAKGHRLKCQTPLEKPVIATHVVEIRTWTGEGVLPTSTVPLTAFIQSVDRGGLKGARFDMNSMSCPFDLNVTLMQPYAPNVVTEQAQPDPARAALLAWIRTLKFQFPTGSEKYGIGTRLKVSVPCMVLDLS